MPIPDLSAYQRVYSCVMMVGGRPCSRLSVVARVGYACAHPSLDFPVCLRMSLVNCWDLMVSLTGHTDCTFLACIGGGWFMEGEQSVVTERSMHEAGWPVNWICFQGWVV
jgi:hypothetical protein